jgi:hypothetical protein
VKINQLVAFMASFLLCASAFCDPISYTETFDASGDNRDWGTDHALVTQLFGSNYDEDGAQHSNTGGIGNSGYDYTNFAWEVGQWHLLFADADASGGNLAGNKDYSDTPALTANLQISVSAGPTTTFLLASTGDSGTTPDSSTNLYYWNTTFFPSQTWTEYSADLTDADNWTRIKGSAEFTDSLLDVDLVGIIFLGSQTGSPEMRVDDFTATPEPGLLMTMAPLAGFLGWRLRISKRRKTLSV